MQRPLILKLLSRFMLLWVGGIFFAVGVMFAYFGLDEWQKHQRFKADSVQAQGTVVSKSLERAMREEKSSHQVSRLVSLLISRRTNS